MVKKTIIRGWGFSSVVECLPSERKALGSVPSSEKKNQKKKKKKSRPNSGQGHKSAAEELTSTVSPVETQQGFALEAAMEGLENPTAWILLLLRGAES